VFSVFGGKKKKRKEVPQFDPMQFWHHANFAGVAAREVGTACGRFGDLQPDDLYICGLLHDIGKIILLEKAPDAYAAVLAEAEKRGRSDTEIEKEKLGFTHADVGSVLAIKWFLPEDLTIAIRYHHAPEKDPFDHSLSSLIHLADHLAWSAGSPSTRGLVSPSFRHDVFEALRLEPKDVDQMLPAIEEKFRAMGLPF
jgi:HD-like signal output (HDOD) protein